jgi:hypothetical protein
MWGKVEGWIDAALAAGEVNVAKQAHCLPKALTVDEAAAIHLYTQINDFHKILNECMRSKDRGLVKCFLPYLRLLLGGLYKLPLCGSTVYRGIKAGLLPEYNAKGKMFVWWSITSTSGDMGVATGAAFVGSGNSTLFAIHGRCLVNIKDYSAHPTEEEYILLPGTLQVAVVMMPLGACPAVWLNR